MVGVPPLQVIRDIYFICTTVKIVFLIYWTMNWNKNTNTLRCMLHISMHFYSINMHTINEYFENIKLLISAKRCTVLVIVCVAKIIVQRFIAKFLLNQYENLQ